MKFLIILITISLLINPHPVFAHAIGQPPYFKVNGTFTDYYPVPTVSVADFKLPNDIAAGLFLLNQPIEFEIDVNALPVPAEVVGRTKFLWEFGDGTSGQGLKNSHTYTNPGTYFIDIKADSGQGFEPQLLQSTAINILPHKDYKLPKSVIEVNGKQAKDPLSDIIEVNFSEKQEFNANKSDPGSSQIVSYFWDMGDMTSGEGLELTYSYTQNPYTVFPVLRVTTADGFIADSFVQIKDESGFTEDKGFAGSFKSSSGMDRKIVAGGILLSLLTAGILTFLVSKFLSKKNKSASK